MQAPVCVPEEFDGSSPAWFIGLHTEAWPEFSPATTRMTAAKPRQPELVRKVQETFRVMGSALGQGNYAFGFTSAEGLWWLGSDWCPIVSNRRGQR